MYRCVLWYQYDESLTKYSTLTRVVGARLTTLSLVGETKKFWIQVSVTSGTFSTRRAQKEKGTFLVCHADVAYQKMLFYRILREVPKN